MGYQWKQASRVHLDAELVGKAFEAIEQRDGNITPARVVDEARPENAPLHPAFEWDDTVAAETYRMEQAKYLIRMLVVTDVHPEQTEPVRGLVSVIIKPADEEEDAGEWKWPGAGKQCYVSTARALQDDVWRRQVLRQALWELSCWERRYQHLEELALLLTKVGQERLVAQEALV